ncbi:hypothetical protein [Endozoicomonas sp. OPT23]|uniref:hypothetical protein n=1 Tax=Endozoicomonas sp. OPT23 TaxID=2072845 RepID=UPI00129A5B12|nr:hypothetical protein [Endozoicomonas sp. OPT23]
MTDGLTERVIECISSLASYDVDNDVLRLSNDFAQIPLGDQSIGNLPVVLNRACYWVQKGFDIVFADGEDSPESRKISTTVIHSGLLLKPAEESYWPLLSELVNGANYPQRAGWMKRDSSELDSLRKNCKNISPHYLDHSLSATCPDGEEGLPLVLRNAAACMRSGLDIVLASNGLYCLDVEGNLGTALAININEIRSSDDRLFNIDIELGELISDHSISDAELTKVLSAIRRYMANQGYEKYIKLLERVGGGRVYFVEQFFNRLITSRLLPLTSVEHLLIGGVVREIRAAGGFLPVYGNTGANLCALAMLDGILFRNEILQCRRSENKQLQTLMQ